MAAPTAAIQEPRSRPRYADVSGLSQNATDCATAVAGQQQSGFSIPVCSRWARQRSRGTSDAGCCLARLLCWQSDMSSAKL
eukprot:7227617-Pyramimonas_sp.AAC.1